MKMKVLGIFVAMAGMASMASATVFTPCASPSGATVLNVNTTLSGASGNSVACGSFTFSNFDVLVTGSSSPSAQLNIQGYSSSFATADGSAYLGFNIGSISGFIGDILMHYTVTGPLSYVDNTNLGTSDPNVQIIESVYTVANCSDASNTFSYSLCHNPLTTLVTNGGGSGTSPVFATSQSSVIIKDIQFHNNGLCGPTVASTDTACVDGSISEFTNSQHTAVPEPMTLSLMGAGLLGLGLLRKRIGRS